MKRTCLWTRTDLDSAKQISRSSKVSKNTHGEWFPFAGEIFDRMEVVCVNRTLFYVLLCLNSHFVNRDGERCLRKKRFFSGVASLSNERIVCNHESSIMRTSHAYSRFSQLFHLRLRQLRGRLTAWSWTTWNNARMRKDYATITADDSANLLIEPVLGIFRRIRMNMRETSYELRKYDTRFFIVYLFSEIPSWKELELSIYISLLTSVIPCVWYKFIILSSYSYIFKIFMIFIDYTNIYICIYILYTLYIFYISIYYVIIS